MKTKKMLALLLAVAFCLGLLPIGELGLSVAKADNVTWPQITGFTYTKIYWASSAEFDDNITGAAIGDPVITQYDALEPKTEGSTTEYYAGEIVITVDGLCTNSKNAQIRTNANAGESWDVTIAWNGDEGTKTTTANISFTANNSYTNTANLWLSRDGVKYYYKIKLHPQTSQTAKAPVLTVPTAERTSESTASLGFSSSEEGTYYLSSVYDVAQTSPTIDTTEEGRAMVKGKNTVAVSNLSGIDGKYIYVVGKNDVGMSKPLEIAVPGVTYVLGHAQSEVFAWDVSGNGKLVGKFYTEQFTDSNGNAITKAAPGDIVTVTLGAFEPDSYIANEVSYENGVFSSWKDSFKLSGWNIEGVTEYNGGIAPTAESYSFSFKMPERDVQVQAVLQETGATVKLSTNVRNAAEMIGIYGGNSSHLLMLGDNAASGQVMLKAGLAISARFYGCERAYKFKEWQVKEDGQSLNFTTDMVEDIDGKKTPCINDLILEEGKTYDITLLFDAKTFSTVRAAVNNAAMGSATVAVGSGSPGATQIAYEGDTVTLTAAPGERYKLTEWNVVDADGTPITVAAEKDDTNKATFTMPATSKAITATANFAVDPDKASNLNVLSSVTLYDAEGGFIAAGSKNGTSFTITLPHGYDTTNLATDVLKLACSPYATIRKSGEDVDWPAEGKACDMALDTPTTFTVKAEDGTEQSYTITITKAKSSDKDITAAALLNVTGDTTPIAEGVINESAKTITITLAQDTDSATLNSIGMKYLKLTHSAGANVAMTGGYSDAVGTYKWANGDVMCNMSLNTPSSFVVTAEDGSTKTYTITIAYTAPDVPNLSAGTAERTSDTTATVKFTSSEAGAYFYSVVNSGAAAPTIGTSTGGTSAVVGENTIALTNLTVGARDIYIIVKNAAGVESTALKVEIPAFSSADEGTYSITVSAPTGGTITPNRTKANAGDTITVTVTPNAGMQMVSGSLTYTIAVAGGATVNITGNTFTMPENDVSLTCRWETATATTNGITGFSINGVAGAVNNSSNTISVTLPYGTDVTRLVPTIAGSNIASISPSSGTTVNFSKPVTYTVTMTDGTVKTYTVTVYVAAGTAADEMWDKLTDFYNQVPWWKYAENQQNYGRYPRYW
jgi:hypothetical protein